VVALVSDSTKRQRTRLCIGTFENQSYKKETERPFDAHAHVLGPTDMFIWKLATFKRSAENYILLQAVGR